MIKTSQLFFLFSTILCSLNTSYGQQNATSPSREDNKFRIISITPEVLFTRDFTVQTSAIDGSKTYPKGFGDEVSAGAIIRFKTKNNLNFETGYRWKLHWSTSELLPYFGYGIVIDESHSVPFRAIWEKRTKNKRLGISASGGVLMSYMTHSYSGGGTTTLSGMSLSGPHTSSITFKPPGSSTPRLVPFLDGVFRVDFRFLRHWDLTLGYGGSKGFLNLSDGQYNVTSPTQSFPPLSGTLVNKGSYRYIMLGLGWIFNN
jgi:hypothetical protein